jgi:hypothetical protein
MRRASFPAPPPVVWAAGALAALVAAFGVVGADALWLVSLGGEVAHGRLPASIAFATAPSAGWHDVPAGGELLFWAAYHAFGGARGLVVLQAAAAAVAVGTVARGVARQSSSGSTFAVSLLVIVGSLPQLAVANSSLFSVALFPILLALLESESERSRGRLWLSVPLLALWANLHGAVLLGWALLACHLVFARARRRPREALAVFAAATVAVFLDPALWHTPSYYASVFRNAAAQQHLGLWTPLRATPFGVLLVLAAVAMTGLAVRRRSFLLWEAIAAAGLAVATIAVARNGIFLLCVLAYPAGRSFSRAGPRPRLLAAAAVGLAVGAVVALVSGAPDPGSWSLARAAARSGQVVLAEPVLAQQVALSGGRVWLTNPLDAFRLRDQRLYVDWFSGKARGAPALRQASLVLVRAGSAAGRRAAADRRLVLLRARDGAALYRVRQAVG